VALRKKSSIASKQVRSVVQANQIASFTKNNSKQVDPTKMDMHGKLETKNNALFVSPKNVEKVFTGKDEFYDLEIEKKKNNMSNVKKNKKQLRPVIAVTT